MPLYKAPPTIPSQEPSLETEMRRERLNALWSEPIELMHDHLSKLRAKNSGDWVFALHEFRDWHRETIESPEGAEKAGNCLCLNGNLGTGKTMLMNTIIRSLKLETSKDPGQESMTVYYYFDRSGGCKPSQAFSSLLRQIYDQGNTPLPTFLAEMGTSRSGVAKSASSHTDNEGVRLANLVSDFLAVQSRFKRVYICLDGLEECDDLVTLTMILSRVSAIPEIRLAITARPKISDLCTKLGIISSERVVQLERHNSSDIRQYLEEFIKHQDHSCVFDMAEEARSGLIDKLVEKSGTNFLSAIAQATQISRLTSLAEIDDQLDTPPPQLPDVFDLILSQFNDQSPQQSRLARKILYWLSVARRPLTLRELQQAVAAEPGTKITDHKRLPTPNLIAAVCMGFVRIDIERNRVFTIPSAMPFYLYQFGREFPAQAREYAAISCGALLESDILSHGPFTSQFQYDDMEKQLPFAKYASQNWGVHLEEAGFGEVMSTTLENNSLLETLSQLLHVSSQSTSPSPRLFNDYPSGFGSRHFAAYFGAETALNKWFTQEDRVAARDSWNRSPFHVCFRSPGLREPHTVYPEFESYCELITGSKEADSGGEPENTESEDDAQLKPFRHETVEKLPWTWASVSDEEQGYGSPCTSMGKFLKKLYILSKDEMKVADIDGRSPLHGFIADWPESLFISLVKTMASNDDEASTNDDDSDSETYSKYVVFPPIDADSLGQTLLDCACQRDERFSYLVFETAKLWPEQINRGIVTAASCGYTELVKHLCEAIESDSGAKDSGLGQAVIEASKRGFTDVIRWLNRMRIDLHAQDSEGMSPLHHAAYGGHTDTVRFLLLEGGDPTQLDNMGRSPLFCGCESGSDKITTLLSEKGASVAQVNKGGQTLLHLAALKGNADVTRRLLKLDYGAAQRGVPDLDTAGPVLQSPLHIAAREGHGAIVKLLVEGGYPILACDADGRTPLSYASEGGHFESVEVLLTKRAIRSADEPDHHGRTSLSYAAAGGHADIVAILLEYGADANVQDDVGKTALIHAAEGGYNDTVVVLTLLANENYTVINATMKFFREIYSRFSDRPTGDTPIDMKVKDNEGRSLEFYVRKNGGEKASDLIQYLEEVDQSLKT